jgi:hypothetical protein
MKQFFMGVVVTTVIFVTIISSVDIPEYTVIYRAVCV